MSKTVQFKQPQTVVAATAAAEAWINAKPADTTSEPTKRLTFNIPESLHRLIKVRCAQDGVQMNDKLCEIVRAAFSMSAAEALQPLGLSKGTDEPQR